MKHAIGFGIELAVIGAIFGLTGIAVWLGLYVLAVVVAGIAGL